MEHTCRCCGGSGKVTCPRCGGDGKIQGETCYYCRVMARQNAKPVMEQVR